jgi:hypothetical protein
LQANFHGLPSCAHVSVCLFLDFYFFCSHCQEYSFACSLCLFQTKTQNSYSCIKKNDWWLGLIQCSIVCYSMVIANTIPSFALCIYFKTRNETCRCLRQVFKNLLSNLVVNMTLGRCKFSTTSKNVELRVMPLIQGVIMATLVSIVVVACETFKLSSCLL